MAFLTVGGSGNKSAKDEQQRLYIMQIEVAGTQYLKIGKSSGASSKRRLLEICGSYYDKYRTTPIMKMVRDQKCDSDTVFKMETILHRYFVDYKYTPSLAFSGSCELFDLVRYKDDVIQAYEAVLSGMTPDEKYINEDDIIPF